MNSIFHDLRTPMVTIGTMASYLNKEVGICQNANCQDYLKRQIRNVDYCRKLLDDLESFSKLDEIKMNYDTYNFYDLVDDALMKCTGKISESDRSRYKFIFNKSISTTIDNRKYYKNQLLEIFPLISCDYKSISRVLQNLIDNGIKYSKNTERPEIEIYTETNPSRTHCFISDNGIGILTSEKEKILKPLVRGRQVDEYKGSGLGLAISNILLRLHDSTIRINNKGKTIISFSLSNPKED